MTVAPVLSRVKIADLVVQRLGRERMRAAAEFRQSGRVASFILEDGAARGARPRHLRGFPAGRPPGIEAHIGAVEYMGYQMDAYDPLLTHVVYAFQGLRIVRAIGDITGLAGLLPDDKLYAGGISLMTQGQYLNPHLDNSHDIERNNYRVLKSAVLYHSRLARRCRRAPRAMGQRAG